MSNSKIFGYILFLFIAIIFFLYLIFISPFISLPPLGKHAWNESIYLTFLHSIIKNNNPFFFYQAYDLNRPDFNVGYVYFWTNYLLIKLVKIINLSELFSFRLLSTISTLLSLITFSFILIKFKLKKFIILLSLIFFLFSPLVIYYGWKAQLEPFLILLFLVSQFTLIKFIKGEGGTYSHNISCLILGILIASRSNFIVFLPLYFIPFLFSIKEKDAILKKLQLLVIPIFLIVGGILIMILPSSILYPQYSPLTFLYKRIFEAGIYAFSAGAEIKSPMLVFINDALWKQIALLLPFSIFSFFIFKNEIKSPRLRIYFLLLAVVTLIFFSLTYIHTSNHTYQTYYGILWFVLASSISLNFFIKIFKKYISRLGSKKQIPYMIIFSFVLLNVFLSCHFTTSFYGLYTEEIYDDIDAYGTYESYMVGSIIKYILNEANDTEGYILVQSPTVYYPTHHPSLDYNMLYKWNNKTKSYTGYSFFKNQSEFIEEIKSRSISILTITPDVFGSMSKKFSEYKNFNFVDICYTKNFVISINKEILHQNPKIKIKCINFLLNLTSNDDIASRVLSSDWLTSMDVSCRLCEDLEELSYYKHSTKKFQIPEIDSLRNNFTLALFLYTDSIEEQTDIVSKGSIWKIRFGNRNDIYMECPKTSEGYGWIDGVYYTPNLFLPTCIVFRYSSQNANIFVNGINKSETFYLIKNNTRVKTSPTNLLFSDDPLIIGNEKFEGRIKIQVFNRVFDNEEITRLCSIKIPEEFIPNLIFESE